MQSMNRASRSILLVVAAALLIDAADAGVAHAWYRPYNRRGYGNAYNGAANLIRAQAMANASNAQAALNYEQARAQYLENKKKWTADYYQSKEERQARMAREREKNKLSTETLAEIARAERPKVLGADALNPATGHITWPEVLREEEFATLRVHLEEQFAQQARTSPNRGSVTKIHAQTQEMLSLLRSHIEEMPANDYIAGRRFLDSLDYTARQHS